jgi:type IV pilus assembly protein PilM
VEDAVISYQVASSGVDQTRLLVTVIPRDVLVEYESVVREAGFYAGVVLPSTLAATTLVGTEAALLVNRNGNTLTTAIVRGEELLLHRALEFELDQDGEGEAPRRAALDQAIYMESLRADDIRQTVSVAMAYYEDTLAAVPSSLYYIGPGTVSEFEALLGEGLLAPRTPGETQMVVRELLPAVGAESLSVPRALLAPVAGALMNG